MRRNQTRNNNNKSPISEKRSTDLDTSDLLIESAFELSRWRGRRCACDTPDIVGCQNVLNRLSPFSNKSLACNQLQAKVDSIPIA
jgi:hypothetical protein